MKRGTGALRAQAVGALATLATVIMLAAPGDAVAISWAPVTGSTNIIYQVGKVRSADGTLHVVWKRDTPGSSGASGDIMHVAIGASGVIGSASVVASGFSSVSNPSIVTTAGGGLMATFGGIQCLAPSCQTGLFTSTSADGGRTWAAPTALFDRDAVYGSDINAATLADGTPFESWSGTLGVFVHRGIDGGTADYNYQTAMGAGCCGYQSNLTADSAGGMQLAWDSNATGYLGVWTRAVDPVSGAPSGTPMLMPGSVTQYSGAPQHAQMLTRTPIVAVPGQPGQFWVAYPGGYPSLTKVLLWRVGSSGSTTVVNEAGEHNQVSLAADATGRLWVFWSHGTSSAAHIYARRLGTSGLEPVIDLGAPAGAQSTYALTGDVSPGGDPEALALVGFADGSAGSYYARGPQIAPPQSGKSVDVAPVSGTVQIKLRGQRSFTVLGSGAQVPVGSTVDATRGRVRLTSARGGKGGTQTADFYNGAFLVAQRPGQALTSLKLTGGNARVCGRAEDLAFASRASARRRLRYLTGSGTGSFSTVGRYAAATVRGTIWLTEDDCGGTLIQVQRGTVTVRDLVRRKTITVRAGHRYFAAR
jgi:hypothetical protein